MAKKDDKKIKESKKVEKPLLKLNGLFNDITNNISFNTFSSDNKREREHQKLSDEIDNVVFQEIHNLTSFTGDDISTFLVKLFNEYEANTQITMKNIEDIFANDDNGVFQFFQDKYKNTNLLYEDLNMICGQLYELQEAINATRDAIATSDDVSQSLSRSLKFKNASDTDTAKSGYINIIENMESKFKVIPKIKNHIIPKTLQYGKYYAYTIPYSKMFESYYRNKVKDKNNITSTALESADENLIKSFKDELGVNMPSNTKNIFNSYTENIEVYNDEIAIPIIEGTDISALLESKSDMIADDEFRKKVEQQIKKADKNNKKKNIPLYNDGTINLKTPEADFSNIQGCYIKLIDPRRVIPIKILDQVIGYYYIHDTNIQFNKSPFSTNIKINQGNLSAQDVENSFLSKVSDRVVKAFDKKFLENNSKFKELIMNALQFNDLYKKQIKFQFIPIDYMTEFTVNEDENGEGTSVLVPALFYAKLYLSLLIFKMISVITKSNDTKIYYVKQSGIDTNVVNKVQDVARQIKEKQINFMDLLNYNSMLGKIGQGKEVFMPVGKSGDRGIEFDILAGQDIQLNTDFMEMLRTGFINATGVPSVIMNYINEADYAKTLVMANAKFTGRVVNYQLDFNNSITELYKKLLRYSTEVPDNFIQEFEFVLAAPKSLNNMNMADLISNTDNTLAFMIKAITGENADPGEDGNKLKDMLYRKLSREMLPMIPWATADKIYEEAKVELVKEKIETKNTDEDQTT
jgi:hypothetical protein